MTIEVGGRRIIRGASADVGQLRAARGLERAPALDWGRVEQQQVVARTGALRGEHPEQPLDRVGEAGAPLVQRILRGQAGEEMAELAAGRAQETAVTRDPHQHLHHAQGHHLRIAQPPARVVRTVGQEVVGRAVDTDQEQVEVGVHRGLLVDGVQDTADFDLLLLAPISTAGAVASSLWLQGL